MTKNILIITQTIITSPINLLLDTYLLFYTCYFHDVKIIPFTQHCSKSQNVCVIPIRPYENGDNEEAIFSLSFIVLTLTHRVVSSSRVVSGIGARRSTLELQFQTNTPEPLSTYNEHIILCVCVCVYFATVDNTQLWRNARSDLWQAESSFNTNCRYQPFVLLISKMLIVDINNVIIDINNSYC